MHVFMIYLEGVSFVNGYDYGCRIAIFFGDHFLPNESPPWWILDMEGGPIVFTINNEHYLWYLVSHTLYAKGLN